MHYRFWRFRQRLFTRDIESNYVKFSIFQTFKILKHDKCQARKAKFNYEGTLESTTNLSRIDISCGSDLSRNGGNGEELTSQTKTDSTIAPCDKDGRHV